jgi:ubiquinone/menaquinone biosynthesis C-methylase UbiE/acyl-coenzyme A thioesterase PaaI-like protein
MTDAGETSPGVLAGGSAFPPFPGTASDRELARLGHDLIEEYRLAIEFAVFPADESVLDVATGSGRMAYALAAAGLHVVSGDVDAAAVRDAREHLSALTGSAVEFRALDACRLGFPDSSVPSLITSNALHHMEQPLRALEEMARVMATDGKLVIVEFSERGFDVMDQVHHVVHGRPHERGTLAPLAICEFLRSRFQDVRHHVLPLNDVWIAAGKRARPLRTEDGVHAACFACGPANPYGLQLRFQVDGPDGVVAQCVVEHRYQGFDGVVQGGIVSLLLDSAMANVLLRHGIQAMTARLRVRFQHPLRTGIPLRVRARMKRARGLPARQRVHLLEADIEQEGLDCAAALGTFVRVRARSEGEAD